MTVEFGIGKATGTVAAPPSKSFAHRLLIAAGLYSGCCTVEGVALSDDISRTLDCLKALGCRFEIDGGCVSFLGREPLGGGDTVILPCGESGSTLRFFVPIALAFGGDFLFRCSPRLRERGIGGYDAVFEEQGISKTVTGEGFCLKGRLAPGAYRIDVSSSSQYLTGLLMALPLLRGESRICTEGRLESSAYIDITLDVLRQAGIGINLENGVYVIPGCGKAISGATRFTVEGDWSNAAFLEGFNLIGGDVTVTGLNPLSSQGDRKFRDHFKALSEGFAHIDISEQIDLGPVLFTLAALSHGAEITGTRRLALKESDRVSAMLEELSAFGVRYSKDNNSVTIYESPLHAPGRPLEGHNDHRIVMALALPLSLFGGRIEGAEAVRKSFPDFFETLGKLGIKTKNYADQG